MVHRAAPAAERREDRGVVTAPSARAIFFDGLPGLLREGFLPVAAFYIGLRFGGLAAGVAAAGAVSVLIYLHERRAGRGGLLVRLSLAFVVVQSAAGLASRSATVYLATPVVANAVWGLAFLVSAAVRRPLAGVFACAWYPFSREFRSSPIFRRVYGVESLVWGAYLLARSALRLAVLLQVGVGGYLVVMILTGTPMVVGLIAWSVWYAVRRFARDETVIPATVRVQP